MICRHTGDTNLLVCKLPLESVWFKNITMGPNLQRCLERGPSWSLRWLRGAAAGWLVTNEAATGAQTQHVHSFAPVLSANNFVMLHSHGTRETPHGERWVLDGTEKQTTNTMEPPDAKLGPTWPFSMAMGHYLQNICVFKYSYCNPIQQGCLKYIMKSKPGDRIFVSKWNRAQHGSRQWKLILLLTLNWRPRQCLTTLLSPIRMTSALSAVFSDSMWTQRPYFSYCA